VVDADEVVVPDEQQHGRLQPAKLVGRPARESGDKRRGLGEQLREVARIREAG